MRSSACLLVCAPFLFPLSMYGTPQPPKNVIRTWMQKTPVRLRPPSSPLFFPSSVQQVDSPHVLARPSPIVALPGTQLLDGGANRCGTAGHCSTYTYFCNGRLPHQWPACDQHCGHRGRKQHAWVGPECAHDNRRYLHWGVWRLLQHRGGRVRELAAHRGGCARLSLC